MSGESWRHSQLNTKIFVFWFAVLLTIAYFVFGTYHNRPYKVAADGKYYYMYLVSFVNDFDFDFTNDYRTPKPSWMVDEIDLYNLKTKVIRTTGRPLNVWTCGPAILWFPFFALAFITAGILDKLFQTGIGIDPWIRYYQYFTLFSSVVYSAITALFMADVMRNLFKRYAIYWAVVLIFWGTNLWYYSVIEASLSHATDLFTLTLFFWLFLRIHRGDRRLGNFYLLGLSGGLHCLVRTQNLASIAIFTFALLWREFRTPYTSGIPRSGDGVKAYLAMLIFSLLPILIINTYMMGKPFTVPQGDRFFYPLNPHIIEVLFSGNNGLFFHNPILIFGLIGYGLFIHRLMRTDQIDALPYVSLGLVFCIQLYINSIAVDWWGGNALGQRRMISSYLMFSIGLAYMGDILVIKIHLRRAWIMIGSLALFVNIYMTLVFLFAYRLSENIYDTMFHHLPGILLYYLRNPG